MSKKYLSVLSLILSICLLLSFVSCKDEDNKGETTTAGATEEIVTAAVPATDTDATSGTIAPVTEPTGGTTAPAVTDKPDDPDPGTGDDTDDGEYDPALRALIDAMIGYVRSDSVDDTKITLASLMGEMLPIDIGVDSELKLEKHFDESGIKSFTATVISDETETAKAVFVDNVLYVAKTGEEGTELKRAYFDPNDTETLPDGAGAIIPVLYAVLSTADTDTLLSVLYALTDPSEVFGEMSMTKDEEGRDVITIGELNSTYINSLLSNLLAQIIPYDFFDGEDEGEEDGKLGGLLGGLGGLGGLGDDSESGGLDMLKPILKMLVDAVQNDEIDYTLTLTAPLNADGTFAGLKIEGGVTISISLGGFSIPVPVVALEIETTFGQVPEGGVNVEVPENADQYEEVELGDLLDLSGILGGLGDPGEDDPEYNIPEDGT